MTDIFDYVMVENILSKQECEVITSILNDRSNWSPHTWYNNANEEYSNEKDFTIAYDTTVSRLIKPNVISAVKQYSAKHKDSGPTYSFSAVRINRYQQDESIQEHVDHIHSLFDGEKKGIPILSFVGLFNDDFEGGDFILAGKKIDLKAGDVVVFPSIFIYPHQVTTVTKGTRYSWVMWTY